jgi:ATP-dependent HslUV protease ATP-binding subunit HslU
MTALLDDILFDAPDEVKSEKIIINRELVDMKLSNIVKNRDLSRFIL